MGLNPLSGIIICASVRPVNCGPFDIFIFVLISIVGGTALQCIYFINLHDPRFPLRVTIYAMFFNLIFTLLIYWPAVVADMYNHVI